MISVEALAALAGMNQMINEDPMNFERWKERYWPEVDGFKLPGAEAAFDIALWAGIHAMREWEKIERGASELEAMHEAIVEMDLEDRRRTIIKLTELNRSTWTTGYIQGATDHGATAEGLAELAKSEYENMRQSIIEAEESDEEVEMTNECPIQAPPESILPAYDRTRKVLGNPKSSPDEIGDTMMMLKYARTLPAHLQHAMNNPDVPIQQVVGALHEHAASNPDQALGCLNPLLKSLAERRLSPRISTLGLTEILDHARALAVKQAETQDETDWMLVETVKQLAETLEVIRPDLHQMAREVLDKLGAVPESWQIPH
jgi:hypothetical protein